MEILSNARIMTMSCVHELKKKNDAYCIIAWNPYPFIDFIESSSTKLYLRSLLFPSHNGNMIVWEMDYITICFYLLNVECLSIPFGILMLKP